MGWEIFQEVQQERLHPRLQGKVVSIQKFSWMSVLVRNVVASPWTSMILLQRHQKTSELYAQVRKESVSLASHCTIRNPNFIELFQDSWLRVEISLTVLELEESRFMV